MFVKFRQNFIKISKKNTNFHAFFMKFELNNLFKLFKNDKIVTTFLLKFWDLSGAKVWKSCRSRKSWKNEYLVAIVAVDTAENGPPKVWRNWIIYSFKYNFSKFWDARSRLYRRQILQVNIRWKALDEIYKMYILLHRSDLKISAKKVVIILVKLNRWKFMKIQFIRIFAILTFQRLFYF